MFAGKDTFFREHFRRYIIYYNIKHEQYRVAFRELLMSGDSELNPGPVGKKNSQCTAKTEHIPCMLLESRLNRQGLRSLDVGGGGDCFFRFVSHQLYGDPTFNTSAIAG